MYESGLNAATATKDTTAVSIAYSAKTLPRSDLIRRQKPAVEDFTYFPRSVSRVKVTELTASATLED